MIVFCYIWIKVYLLFFFFLMPYHFKPHIFKCSYCLTQKIVLKKKKKKFTNIYVSKNIRFLFKTLILYHIKGPNNNSINKVIFRKQFCIKFNEHQIFYSTYSRRKSQYPNWTLSRHLQTLQVLRHLIVYARTWWNIP